MDWMGKSGRDGKRSADYRFVVALSLSVAVGYYTNPLLALILFILLYIFMTVL